MKRKLKAIILLICVMVASVILASCSTPSIDEQYEKQGYTVKVTYDGNGGVFVGKQGNQIIDYYRPENYKLDGEGKAHIKLIEPTERVLMSTNEPIMLTMNGYSNVGWYKTRKLVTNENGEPVDEDGNILEESDGRYYIKGSSVKSIDGREATTNSAEEEGDSSSSETETRIESLPLYEYSDPFNFETDTIDAKVGEKVEITLYAGWLKHYEFNYYHVKDGVAELVDTQTFDYKVVNSPNSKVFDKDTIWLPSYVGGAMNYQHAYNNQGIYSFPEIENETFDKAYLDAELKTQITTETFEHTGTFDSATCKATNRVQNIYFTTVPGRIYKIHNAEELVENPDLDGIYEIYGSEYDFENLTWPTLFSQGMFNGTIKPMENQTVKFSNISARFASQSSTTAGVFGALSDTATVENIAFENVTLTVTSVATNLKNMTMGILFGNIDDEAKVTNISLTNAKMDIGYVSINTVDESNNNQVNLLGNGNTQGITVTDTLHLQISGRKVGSTYRFLVDPTKATVDANNNVSLVDSLYTDENGKQIYEIQ